MREIDTLRLSNDNFFPGIENCARNKNYSKVLRKLDDSFSGSLINISSYYYSLSHCNIPARYKIFETKNIEIFMHKLNITLS